jgi:hypothetical protein
MTGSRRLLVSAALVVAWVLVAVVPPAEAAGRYKKEGDRCVWDANDSGPNQCTPPSGRYKKDGDKCEWDARDGGPDQCTPSKGRFKLEGDKCVWDARDSGTDQCRPNAASPKKSK